MLITYKGQGNGDMKKIKIEGDKGKEVVVHYGIVPWNRKRGMITIFHRNGTRIIPSRKDK
jgi:hypothetical protein